MGKQTLRSLCQAINTLCESKDTLEDPEVDLALLRRRAEQLLSFAEKLEQLQRKSNGDEAACARIPSRKLSWPLVLGSMAMLVGGCYAWRPALSFRFDAFMDDAMILKNANVYEPIDWKRIWRTDYWGLEMFVEGVWTHKSFRPLAVLSFRFNHWLHTFDSSGFHIANVALHAASSVLLGLFGRVSVGLPLDWSLLMCALFFVHPVHTENVLYIVGRADLLCLILILVAALLYTPCIARRVPFPIALPLLLVSNALLLASGLCKETGFCFYGLLAGWEILRALRSRGNQLPHLWRLGGILVLGAAAVYWRMWYTGGTDIERMDPQSNSIAVHSDPRVRKLSYALLHGIYAKLLVWPSFLCYDYSLDAIPLVFGLDDARLFLPLTSYVALAMLLTASLRLLAPRARRALPGRDVCEAPIIGVAIVILSFAPMANILWPVGTMIGERLLYIPSAGLLVSLVSFGHLAKPKFSRCWAAALLAACGGGIWRTAERVPEWATMESITVADGKRQLRSSRVQFNYANVLLQSQQYDEALRTYNRAIAVDEEHNVQDSLPLYHAGQILFYQGKNDEAVKYLDRAVTGFYSPLTIKEEEIFHDYALALWFVGRAEDSILNFQKTMALNPYFTKGLNNMGCAMGLGAISGKLPPEYYDHAINALDQAIQVDPNTVLYWRNAIALMNFRGDPRAATVMQQLVNVDPYGGHDRNLPSDCSWEFYFR